MSRKNIPIIKEFENNSRAEKTDAPLELNQPLNVNKISDSVFTDSLNRPLHDLRISVTDRCNFRCGYCMPSKVYNNSHNFLPKSNIITYEEILRVVRLLIPYGLRKVRITGGEPLIRHDLPVLISALTSIKGLDVSLTTNGSLLQKHLDLLSAIHLNRITVSLDAISEKIFMKINDVGFPVSKVLDAINYACKLGMQVKVNMVVMRGYNEGEILPMAKYFRDNFPKNSILRFIEFMDVGNSNSWNMDKVISSQEIINIISAQYPLQKLPAQYIGEVANRYSYIDSKGEIGVISSVTQPFCQDCSRMRLSANGRLYTCLFAEKGYDLLTLIRSGISDEEITSLIGGLWQKRSDRYSQIRNTAGQSNRKKVEMSYIGG